MGGDTVIQVQKVAADEWVIRVYGRGTYASLGSVVEEAISQIGQGPPVPVVDEVLLPELRQIVDALRMNM